MSQLKKKNFTGDICNAEGQNGEVPFSIRRDINNIKPA